MGQMKMNGTLGVSDVIVDSWGSRGASWGPHAQSGRDRGRKRRERESDVYFSLTGESLLSIFQTML